MSKWPFPHIDKHTTYPITFLESVVVKIQSPMESESYQSFCQFVRESFGMDVSSERYNLLSADPLRLKNGSGSIVVKFNGGGMELSIAGQSYHNFKDSIWPLMELFMRYIKKLNTVVMHLSIEAIDVWPFPEETVVNVKAAASAFFSEDLILALGENPGIIKGKEFREDDNADSMIVKYGFIKNDPDNPKQPDRLILDTIAVHDTTFKPSELQEVAFRLNDWLYDAFHWAVSQNVMNVMKSPNFHEKV